jgi:hypothetical protein
MSKQSFLISLQTFETVLKDAIAASIFLLYTPSLVDSPSLLIGKGLFCQLSFANFCLSLLVKVALPLFRANYLLFGLFVLF